MSEVMPVFIDIEQHRTCDACGRTLPYDRKPKVIYCNPSCRQRGEAWRNGGYKVYGKPRGSNKGYRRHWRTLNEAQSNLCGLCNDPMGDDIAVDHICPIALGGGDEIENLMAVHKACNSRKLNHYDLFALAGQKRPSKKALDKN